MGSHNQNGRRDRDERHRMHGHDDDYGQGQSGYAAGRLGDDRALQEQLRNRNQALPSGRYEEHERAFGWDDRFAGGHGGEEYWLDRGDRPYPQWDRRDRDHERNHRERTGYEGGFSSQGSMGTEGYYGPSSRPGYQQRSWVPYDSRGPHRGKGPMNYARSDERIREHVCEALTEHGEVDATYVEVSVKGGEVTLVGVVEDRRQKRMAEDIADRCPGVKDVQNQLKVGADISRGNPEVMSSVGRADKPRA